MLQLAAVTLGFAINAGAHAQTWPAKPVRVIVPFGPGGGTDIQDNWYAMFLPAGTPNEIVAKLNAEIIKAGNITVD